MTEEHFAVLRQIRVEARNLQRACVEATGAGSLLHMAFDPKIIQSSSTAEEAAIQKLRLVKR